MNELCPPKEVEERVVNPDVPVVPLCFIPEPDIKRMIVVPEPEIIEIEEDCSEQLVLNIALMKVCGGKLPRC